MISSDTFSAVELAGTIERYVVTIHDCANPANQHWCAIVEATSYHHAAYQYPEYYKMFKWDYFQSQSLDDLQAAWGDVICVRKLNDLLTTLLST